MRQWRGNGEAMADGFDRARLEQADVVANASPVEVNLLLPIADPHDVAHGPMLLGEALELVVVEIASKPHGRQHDDVPIVESLASAIVSRMLIDICGDKAENLITKLGSAVNVSQASQDRHDFVATLQIEFDLADRRTIEPSLS